MLTLPDKVKVALEGLRKEYNFFVSLKKINDKYYLYKQTSIWNKEAKKLKVLSTYLGRILEDGTFIKKEITKEDEIENAKAVIVAHGGKVVLPEIMQKEKVASLTSYNVDTIEQKIITIMSMNARAGFGLMEKQTGLRRSTLYNKIKQLENKYAIQYTIEVNIKKFGYFRFLVMAKFVDQKPTSIEIINSIKNEPKIQLATLMTGKYDLLMYVLAESNEAIADLVIKIRKTTLSKYTTEWYIDSFAEGFNSVPLREEFLEEIKDKLRKREYSVLKELNKNSTISFTDIDRKYGFDTGRSQYTYYRLLEEEKLTRTTISLRNLPLKYIGVIFLSLIEYEKFINSRSKYMQNVIEETSTLLNRYILTGDIGIPKGIIVFYPVLNDGELENVKEQFIKLDLGARFDTGIITDILLGSFFYRKLDPNYSRQYEILVEQYKFKPVSRINYSTTKQSKNATEETQELELD